MGVPVSVEELDKSHAALDEATGLEALARELAGAVLLESESVLLREIDEIGDGGLHAEGHLVLLDAGEDLGIADLLEVLPVERFDAVEGAAAFLFRDSFRTVEKEHGISLAPQLHALMHAREVTRLPEIGSGSGRVAGEENDVGG